MANSPEHERVLELQDHTIGTENVAFISAAPIHHGGSRSEQGDVQQG
jgi:hypothetical protein